jgi:cytoskeletal protein CcmA (bactofilin family)
MGATYTRQSSATIVDGTTIEAAHFNNEFDQLVAAFAVSTGHTHDGTTAEGGAITKLLGTAITIGDATAGTDITVTFDGESNDGVLAWMEDEDYFKFSDDILLNSTERLNFGDTGTYIFQSTDGQLDIVADTELQIAATTIDINGNVDISGTLTVAGAVDFGDAALSNVGAVQLDSISGDGDTNTSITFSGSDVITIATGGSGRLTIGDGALSPVTNNQIDLGTASLEFKDGYFDGTVTADAFAGPLTGNVTGNVSGTAATVTTAAQSNITSLGTLTTLTVDNIITNGTTIGHTDDTDLLTLASGVLTVAGELDAVSLDISGDADIDGTLEADAITIGGITLAETIADTVGAMVTSNTESGITVSYDDADNTLDFTVGTLNQNTTGNAATATALETARTIHGVSFDGTANIDLSEVISDTVGAMVTSNTESGITVAYDDADNTLDFTVGTLNQNTTGSAATLTTARTIGGTSFDGSANIAVGLAATATALATARTIGGTSFDGTANIAVALASVGTAVTVADESSDTTCFPLFTTAATGDLPPKSGSNLTFNSSSGLLTATLLAGDLTGDVTGNADTATLASTITATANNTTAETVYLTFVDGATGAQGIETDTGLTWNPNTNVLTAANVAGTVTTATQNSITTATGLVSTGALNSGSITSGFGTIDTGASAITTTGLISGGSLDIDNVLIDGTTIGHTDDTDLITVAANLVTVAGEVQMTTLDIGGTNVTSTAAELNYSDLATLGSTAASKVFTADANNLTKVSGAVLNIEDELTDGATVAWDVIASPVAKLTMAGNRTLSAPSGTTPAAGQFISLLIIQDGTGSRTITWNAVYEFTADTAPTLTTTASLGDLFVFRYNGAKWLEVGRNLNLTLA